MSATERIHHVSLMVTDLEQAEEFYGGVLGLAQLQRPDVPSRGLWYEIGGTQVHVILSEEPDPSSSARHTAFVVNDLAATLEKVAKMGLPIWSDIQIEGWTRKHCRDPFGNGIELLQRVERRSGSLPKSPSYVDSKGEWSIHE